ncbi:MAG: patatin-like phospholipase family protein [Syntrophomonadaceae bacterium]|jgi:NTE family protein|nr:patatin-like phospholipase family protein [Syntrophomonadaceae bacterium]
MQKLGVALGGGGLRGLAHIGVLAVLEKNRIPVHWLAGASSGSIIAALWSAGMSAAAIEQTVSRLKPSQYLDYNISGIVKALVSGAPRDDFSGFIKGRRLRNLVFKATKGKSLRQIRRPLGIVSCDINTGQEVLFTNQKPSLFDPSVTVINDALLSDAVRSSIAIPGAFCPYPFQGMSLVDGGIIDNVPVNFLKRTQADYIMAVNLDKADFSVPSNGFIDIVSRSINILTHRNSSMASQMYADMILRPQTGEASLDDISQAAGIIESGRAEMEKNLPLLLSGLKERAGNIRAFNHI